MLSAPVVARGVQRSRRRGRQGFACRRGRVARQGRDLRPCSRGAASDVVFACLFPQWLAAAWL